MHRGPTQVVDIEMMSQPNPSNAQVSRVGGGGLVKLKRV